MKLVRNIALALGLSLASGALAGSALAEDGQDQRQHRWDDGDNNDGRDRGGDDNDGGRWNGDDGRGDRPGWGDSVSVRFVNHRDQMVTLYLNGRYLGRIAPNSRERIALPCGNHVVTYQVGWRNNRYHQVSVSAFHGQKNRVVIEGRHGGGWGGWGGSSY